MSSFLMSEEIGRYQLSISTAVSKKGKVYVVETVIDRKRFYHTKYTKKRKK